MGEFMENVFEYHQELHHSQTAEAANTAKGQFEYHQELHHSQTTQPAKKSIMWFEYHQELHHSQTTVFPVLLIILFEYHQELHHSQTSNQNEAPPQRRNSQKHFSLLYINPPTLQYINHCPLSEFYCKSQTPAEKPQ